LTGVALWRIYLIMIAELLPGLEKLSREQKWLLVEEIQQELLTEEGDVTMQEPLRSEMARSLEAKVKEYEADPSLASPWSEVRKRLQGALPRK
jgi:putative addiction module component (TIGR02574 family)